MRPDRRAGFYAWLRWAAVSPSSREIQQWAENPNLSALWESIARLIYDPPSENLKRESGSCRRAAADHLLHEASRRLGVAPAPFWPMGAPYALCITHDIDRILSTLHALKRSRHRPLSALSTAFRDVATALVPGWREHNPYFNFKRVVAWERQRGVLSTAFVLFEKRRWLFALRCREIQHVIGVYDAVTILKELAQYEAAGNEVGIHASFDSWKDSGLLGKEKATVENIGIRNVVGVRNHYLNFDGRRSPAVQRAAGFKYDSSLGFNFQPGFRCGTSFPFLLGSLWELPFQLMDSALRYGFALPKQRRAAVLEILEQTRLYGGVLVVNWHLHTMNPNVFTEEMELLDLLITKARADGAWITRCADAVAHWDRRLALAQVTAA